MRTEYVRLCIQTAFSDLKKIQPGILGVQLEMLRSGASDRFTEKPTRTIVSEGSESTVVVDSVSYHAGKKYKTSEPPITDLDFQLSSWRKAVFASCGPEGAWLRYVYARDIEYQHQVDICHRVWDRFNELHADSGLRKMHARTEEKIQRIVWICVQEATRFIRTNAYGDSVIEDAMHSDDEMCLLLGINKRTWQKSIYPARRELIISACFSVDMESLLYATRKRSELIESNWE